MGAWDFWFFLQENLHAHKKSSVEVGVFWVLAGGVEVPILFLWARGFLNSDEVDDSGLLCRRAFATLPHEIITETSP